MTLGILISKAWLNTTWTPEQSNKEAAVLVTFSVFPEGSNLSSAALSQHKAVLSIYICAWRGHSAQRGAQTAYRVSSENLVLLCLPLGRSPDTPKYLLKVVILNIKTTELNARQELAHFCFPWQNASL